MVRVHPARRRTSPRGVVPVGLGDVVGHCHDVANLPGKWLFISLVFLFWVNNFTIFKGMVSYVYVLLNMLAAKREPTPCYRDAYSVDTTFLPGQQKIFFLFFCGERRRRSCMDVSYWEGLSMWVVG